VAEQRRVSDSPATDDREQENGKRGILGLPRDTKPDHDDDHDRIKEVRATDIEPYTGLRYLSKLFRFMAVILLVLLVAEVATGIYTQGAASVPTLLGEASRLIVLAGVLWGTGDLADLLIDVGHDVRASRILAARIAHAAKVAPLTIGRSGSDHPAVERAVSERTSDVALADRPITTSRNLADRADGSGEGPPIP
jgi:hypothetical protein